jgi:hypothetical protein
MANRTWDKLYRLDAPDQVPSWIADQVSALKDGWIPRASDRPGDGWLRVTYEDVSSTRRPWTPPRPTMPPPEGSSEDDVAHLAGWVTLFSVVAILITVLTRL